MSDTQQEITASAGMRRIGMFSQPASPWKLQVHLILDWLSEMLIYAMVIFAPWAFGTTEDWSIGIMNWMAYGLGGLLVLKLLLRWTSGAGFSRWDCGFEDAGGNALEHAARLRFFTRALFVLTVLIVGYCWISMVNARSNYNWEVRSFEPTASYIKWLPSSFDQKTSSEAFGKYLAMALAFWGIRDWLLGKTVMDQASSHNHSSDSRHHARRLPDRMRRLLWVLSINGGLLALECIVQRYAGTGELLFFRRPRWTHFGALSQFGPYTYRSNACQYLCLLWPVCLGFWWSLQRMAKSSDFARRRLARYRHVVLASVLLMAVAPMVSASRLGLAATALLMMGSLAVLHSAFREQRQKVYLWCAVVIIAAAGFGMGWEYVMPRLESDQFNEAVEVRNRLSEAAGNMAQDYPVFGTGPGTFKVLYQFYQPDAELWMAQAHNDWIEVLATFGWVGSAFFACALFVLLARWLIPGGIGAGRRFPILLWLGLGSCLFQARWDFPFQIYSIVFLFVTLSAVAFSLTRRRIE